MIDKKTAEQILAAPLKAGADFTEIFAERRKNTSMSVLNGKTRSVNSGIDMGLGLRVINGEKVIYAFTNDLSPESLLRLAEDTAAAVTFGEKSHIKDYSEKKHENRSKILTLPFGVSKSIIFERLKSANDAAKTYSPLITEVTTSLSAVEQEILIFNSEGLFTEDKRVRTRITVNSTATDKGEKQTGYFGPGASAGFEFVENYDYEGLARKASETAVKMLLAGPAPSGNFPVVIDNGFGGVLFHEACGHGLEAIAIAKNSSVFAGKLGQKIASEKVTAIDDGTIPNSWGSLNFDDEGTETTKNILIENGILKNYMCDNFYGKRIGLPSTGACRRESYKLIPVPRMTNTYIAGGNDSREDIISSVDYGIYCKNMGGGSVNTATAEFNFAVNEAYIIRNGKIAEPVRGATLIGRGNKIIRDIEMVSPDAKLACGMCGASSGSIPVTVGQPMIKVSKMTVGGKA
ncbi:MAG: TldD/PmbA family protein [Clostridiales bacterium]|nr:TldD/PmbA family protein [Clostridiales bacterium]